MVMEFSEGLQCRDNRHPMKAAEVEAIGQVVIVFLMTGSLMLLLIPQVESLMMGFPCCSGWDGCSTILILRFSAVYVLFLLLSAIFALVRSFRRPTTPCLWGLMVLVILSGCWASVYIPPPIFDRSCTDILLFGSMVFMLMQIYVLVRLSYFVIIKLHGLVENGSARAERVQIFFFIAGVTAPVLGEILLLCYYPLCGMNIVFLLTNALIPFLACLWSMSDCVRSTNRFSGFGQGGVFASFIIFYTWSALMSDPDPQCNPYFGNKTIIIFVQCFSVIFAYFSYITGTVFMYNVYVQDVDESNSNFGRDEERPSRRGVGIVQEDTVHVHIPQFTAFLSTSTVCFIAMAVLNWAPVDISDDVGKDSKTAMWFKLIGCWVSVVFFVITLYTPGLYGIYPRRYLLAQTQNLQCK